ncbi:MAG: hypothetical protein JWM25_1157 [Thermoleophilia bacterium]|nr:hypothetical protein [Thermoleophilia bacterium]MCZ4496574.1 hypothetical protein [Thermoleophilia bacterium]
MSPRRTRSRLLDLLVATACVACVAAPALSIGYAADVQAPVSESGSSVDQKVLQSGILSQPLNGTFSNDTSGVVNGSVQWDLYSSSANGMKLLLSTDRSPAMRDAQNGIDVADLADEPKAWDVADNQRGFGFTVVGDFALNRFEDGARWRGFDGKRGVEVARKKTAAPRTRTTVRLRAEFDQALPANARPTANIRATAVAQL